MTPQEQALCLLWAVAMAFAVCEHMALRSAVAGWKEANETTRTAIALATDMLEQQKAHAVKCRGEA